MKASGCQKVGGILVETPHFGHIWQVELIHCAAVITLSSPCVLSSPSQEGVLRGKERIKNTPTTKIQVIKEEMRQVENMEKIFNLTSNQRNAN